MRQTNDGLRPIEQFVGYEYARVSQVKRDIQPATNKAVKAALNRINPDGNNQERG